MGLRAMPTLSTNIDVHIEGYKVKNLLGEGGFGKVYRAQCLRNGMEVAIKRINKTMMREAKMLDKARNEIEIHSCLHHPVILEVYKYFEDTDYIYLVLELCHNGDLQRFLKTQGYKTLSEESAAHIIRQVVQGVLYLHSNQIVHRDLSLANLLLTKDMQVKIADFGLATRLSRPDEKHLTMCGAANYISPEVVTRSPHGPEVDLWGLGCILYTLLVGKPPFDTDNVKRTLTLVVIADYVMPSHLSDHAKDLIDKLLKKNQKDRICLRSILKHTFLTSVENNRLHNEKNYGRDLRLTDGMMDSGIGRTLSSCSRPKIRSRSEERISMMPMMTNDKLSSIFSVKSEALSEPIAKMHSNYRIKYANYRMEKDSILRGIPLPRNKIVLQNEQYDTHDDLNKLKVDRHKREKNAKRVEQTNAKLQVSPLNSNRLQPTRHKTKNIILTVLKNGEVCIEFIKCKNGTERVNEVCRISGDGLRIVLHKVNVEVGSEPPPLPSRGADNIYSYDNLPTCYHRRYLHAYRFVELLRTKTPKLTLYTQHCKCQFMENSPQPNCEVYFYDGVKVIRTDDGVKITESYDNNTFAEGELPSHLEIYYEHYLECYQRCLLLESSLASLEAATGHSCFPVIIGRKPLTALTDTSCQGKENVSHARTSTPVLPSFDGTCSIISTMTSKSRKINSMYSFNNNVEKMMVPGIGYATQLKSGDIRVDYKDGTALVLNPHGDGITYINNNGVTKRYNKHHQKSLELSHSVHEKLCQFPAVVEYLARSKNKNIR